MSLRFFGVAMAVVFSASLAQASVITWLPTQNIANDNDIVNTTSLFQANNLGQLSGNTTVNGVTFTGINSNGTHGNVTILSGFYNNFTGAMTGNTTLLSPEYTTLMDGFQWGGTNVTVRFSNLTIGNDYLVQFWVNDRRTSTSTALYTIFNDGNGNTANAFWRVPANNNLGQYVTGTFMADATTQNITLTVGGGSSANILNAYQISTVVPEPGTLALLAFGSIAIMKFRRKKNS